MATHLSCLPRNNGARHGFTLVELLVVIGIIALLISILLPALSKARFAAHVVACASNQHQIYLATSMYANDNKGYLPGTNVAGVWAGADMANKAQWSAYPWELNYNTGVAYNGDVDPNNAGRNSDIAAGLTRWYGIGLLIGGKYLPPSNVVECADFDSDPAGSNYTKNGYFRLPELYLKATAANPLPNPLYNYNFGQLDCYQQGSYVMNTFPYYYKDPSSPAHGKIGLPGSYGGGYGVVPNPVPHIRALVQCLIRNKSYPNNIDNIYWTQTHQNKGFNCTYIDGHVAWVAMDASAWNKALLQSGQAGVAGNGDDVRGAYFFWAWATLKE